MNFSLVKIQKHLTPNELFIYLLLLIWGHFSLFRWFAPWATYTYCNVINLSSRLLHLSCPNKRGQCKEWASENWTQASPSHCLWLLNVRGGGDFVSVADMEKLLSQRNTEAL